MPFPPTHKIYLDSFFWHPKWIRLTCLFLFAEAGRCIIVPMSTCQQLIISLWMGLDLWCCSDVTVAAPTARLIWYTRGERTKWTPSSNMEGPDYKWHKQTNGTRNEKERLPSQLNGLHLYSAFIQSAVQFMPVLHPYTHTHIHGNSLPSKVPTSSSGAVWG